MTKLRTYSVIIPEEIMGFLSIDRIEKKENSKLTRFGLFAYIIKRAFLLKLQGKESDIEYRELLRISGWSRPYLNSFLETLQQNSILKVNKVGNKKILEISSEIISESNEIIKDEELHVESISKPSDPSQIVSVGKNGTDGNKEKNSNGDENV